MIWIAVWAWLAALVIGAVVLGFCVYEITWKAGRLRGDLQRLKALGETLQGMQRQLAAVQERLSRTGVN